MRRAGLLLVGATVLLVLGVATARANLPRPACEALARWTGAYERNAGWSPNTLRLGGRPRFNALFAAPATATLFGRPVPDWTPEEARGLAPHFGSCAESLRRGRTREAGAALGQLRTQLQRDIPAYLADLAAARAAAPALLAELGAAEPTLALLRLFLALAAIGTEEAAPRAAQAARALPDAQRAAGTALIDALRDLPEAELEAILAPAASRIEPLRIALAEAQIAAIAEAPDSPEGLRQLDRRLPAAELGSEQAARVEAALAARRAAIRLALRQALIDQVAALPAAPDGALALDRLEREAQDRAEALGEAGLAAVLADIAARRGAMAGATLAGLLGAIGAAPATPEGLAELHGIETQSAPPPLVQLVGAEGVARLRREAADRRAALSAEVTALLLRRVAALPVAFDSFAGLESTATLQTLVLLPRPEAARVAAAVAARRRAIAEALMTEFRRSLAELPATEQGLAQIDAVVLPGLGEWPPSAAAEAARFTVAARDRRAAIVAALNRAEAGALLGRAYQGERLRLDFVEPGRLVATVPGEPPTGGPYAEQGEGRVVLELNGMPVILMREGRRLVGGPLVLRRVE